MEKVLLSVVMSSRTTFYGSLIALLALSSLVVNGFPATYVPPVDIEPERERRTEQSDGSGEDADAAAEPQNWLDVLFMPIETETESAPEAESEPE